MVPCCRVTDTQFKNVLPVNSQSQREVLCFWCIQFWIGPQGWLVGLGVLKCSSRTLLSAKHKFWERKIMIKALGRITGNEKKKQMSWACTIISKMKLQTGFEVTMMTLRLKWVRWNSPLLHPSRFSEYLEFSVSFLCMETKQNEAAVTTEDYSRARAWLAARYILVIEKQHSTGKVED